MFVRRCISFLAIACVCWNSAGADGNAADEPPSRVVAGAVADGKAVALCPEKAEAERLSEGLIVAETPINLAGGTDRASGRVRLGIQTSRSSAWRFAYNCVWVGGDAISLVPATMSRVPLGELAFFDVDYPKPRKEMAARYPYAHKSGSLLIYEWWPGPVRGAYYRRANEEARAAGQMGNVGGTGPYPPIKQSHYDFLPVAKESVLLFVMYRGDITVWRGDGKWEQPKEAWSIQWSEKSIEEFKTEITEPFWVGGSEKQYLFVTQSGRLYTAVNGEDGKRKVEPAWRMGSQPIVVVITDVDANRYFAFTKPRRDVKLDGKPVYFELGPDPKPEVYDRDAILKDAKDDPAAVTALARFLVEQGKIKVKK
jgi:hypothetical protein